MKLIITTDWHFTAETPEKRLDNYPEVMDHKIRIITEHAKAIDAIILHGGDLTDTPFIGYGTFCRLVNLLREVRIITVYGQHDLRYRNRGNTPLDALVYSLDDFEILQSDPVVVTPLNSKPMIHIYGSSFGEPVPEIFTKGFNILITHRMILGKEKENWEIEKGYSDAESFLDKHRFDLIISGDNHKSHMTSMKSIKGERYLFNCGSLMRMTTKQLSHTPRYYVFDTDTRTYEEFLLPIKPSEDVFDLEEKVKSEESSEEMKAFIQSLSEQKHIGFDFEEDLMLYEKENSIASDLVEIRKGCM
jgi:DNA repair exonuclease SbcCD nuclease subunit